MERAIQFMFSLSTFNPSLPLQLFWRGVLKEQRRSFMECRSRSTFKWTSTRYSRWYLNTQWLLKIFPRLNSTYEWVHDVIQWSSYKHSYRVFIHRLQTKPSNTVRWRTDHEFRPSHLRLEISSRICRKKIVHLPETRSLNQLTIEANHPLTRFKKQFEEYSSISIHDPKTNSNWIRPTQTSQYATCHLFHITHLAFQFVFFNFVHLYSNSTTERHRTLYTCAMSVDLFELFPFFFLSMKKSVSMVVPMTMLSQDVYQTLQFWLQ